MCRGCAAPTADTMKPVDALSWYYDKLVHVATNVSLLTYDSTDVDDIQWGAKQLELLERCFHPDDEGVVSRALHDDALPLSGKACVWVTVLWGPRMRTLSRAAQAAIGKVLQLSTQDLASAHAWLQRWFPDLALPAVSVPKLISHVDVTTESVRMLENIAKRSPADTRNAWWDDVMKSKLSWSVTLKVYAIFKPFVPADEVDAEYRRLQEGLWRHAASVDPSPTFRECVDLLRPPHVEPSAHCRTLIGLVEGTTPISLGCAWDVLRNCGEYMPEGLRFTSGSMTVRDEDADAFFKSGLFQFVSKRCAPRKSAWPRCTLGARVLVDSARHGGRFIGEIVLVSRCVLRITAGEVELHSLELDVRAQLAVPPVAGGGAAPVRLDSVLRVTLKDIVRVM